MAPTIAMVAALVTACALGLVFRNTKWLGIGAASILAFLFPFPSIGALILGFAIFLAIHKR